MKKLLSIILSITMLLSITTGLNLTAQAETYSGSCGDNVTWSLDTSTGEFVISGTGAMNDASSAKFIPWRSYISLITSVIIQSGVTHIGNYAFSLCDLINSVSIPDSVTTIGHDAFSCCSSLLSVTVPDSVKSIKENAFDMVTNVVYHGNATGSPWGAKAVNGYIEDYFVYPDSNKNILLGCNAQVKSAAIPDSVTSIANGAFCNCFVLTTLKIPKNVISIGNFAFMFCNSLKDVYYYGKKADWDNISIGENNESLSKAKIHYDSNIEDPDSPDFDFGYCGTDVKWFYNKITGELSIKGYDEMNDYPYPAPWREYSKGIKKVVIDDEIKNIGRGAFVSCSNIENVYIGNDVMSIGEKAFALCESLVSITIPCSVTSIGYEAFLCCNDLSNVYYGGTMNDWENINISHENNSLTGATIYCTDGVINDRTIKPTTAPSTTDPTTQKPAESTTQSTTIQVNVEQPTTSATTTPLATESTTQASDSQHTTTTTTSTTTPSTESTTQTTVVSKPKATNVKKATAGKKQFKATWKKVSGVTGYQIQYSTDKKFKKGNKTVTIKGAKKTSTTVKKLKSKKAYYVRIRTYKGKTYSSWSKAKSVKVK